MTGCDAVAHLATALRPGATGTDGMNTNGALRIEGTERLLEAVAAAGIPRYVQQSIVMSYPDRGDDWIEEDTPFDQGEERAAMSHPVRSEERRVGTECVGTCSYWW